MLRCTGDSVPAGPHPSHRAKNGDAARVLHERDPAPAMSRGERRRRQSSPDGSRRCCALYARPARSPGSFLAAGLAEIGGGWLVWKAVREGAPRWWAACGASCWRPTDIPCLQPIDGRATLRGVRGHLHRHELTWARLRSSSAADVEAALLDKGDVIGSAVALIGVAIVLLWPRDDSS